MNVTRTADFATKQTTIYTISVGRRVAKFQLRDDVSNVRLKVDNEPFVDHEMHFGFHARAFAYGRGNSRVYDVFVAEALRILGIESTLENLAACEVSIYGKDATLDLVKIDSNEAYD
jgi:hypothetical protein